MRRHLNTLYITTQGAWLNKDGANVVVSVEGEEIGRVPIHTIGGIVGFGRVSMSPPLMGFCASEGVTVSFLSEYGRFLARMEGPVSGNVLLRREQYRRTDDHRQCSEIVRSFIIGKTLNQRNVIRRALRDHGADMTAADSALLTAAEERLTAALHGATRAADTDSLRGVEGDAAACYFGAFNALIRADRNEFAFNGRNRRPPRDPVNALLSFIYVLLLHDIRSALETVGLDPAVGFLHRERPGRPSLALDIMEEFRPFLADRLVLSLINRRQLGSGDFRQLENGAVLLSDEARKTVLVAYQERKRDETTHPFIEEKMTVGLLWHVQAQLLARHLRGDLDGYPPFTWK
jgi:CRISPR-associated protein Cas1